MKPSTPAPTPAPDPVATAQAQSGLNRDTAQTQQLTNMVNQVGPDGSLTYSPTGSNSFVDSTGKTVTIPQFTATTALSAGQQGIYDTNQVTQQNIATIGKNQSEKIGGVLGTNLTLGNEATEARLMDLGLKRLTPQFAANEEALRTRLANSGIRAGSQAWNAEIGRLGETKNDAINQLLLTGRGQANQEILAERNQPINEITALLSGSQVSSPTFQNTPTTNVAGVDYTGLVQSNYASQVAQAQAAANAKNQSNQAMLGGLFGLAGAGASMFKFTSDRRAKWNIQPIDGVTLDNGLQVYGFHYLGSHEPHLGLMADEVEIVHPEAVAMGAHGFKVVDYAQAVGA